MPPYTRNGLRAVLFPWFALPIFLPALVSAQELPPAYSSESLRLLVAEASALNNVVPHELDGYRASVESEIALVLLPGSAAELAAQVEQFGSSVSWSRSGEFEQRVVGYRARAITANISALSYFRQAWAVPSLYGNRIALFTSAEDDSTRRSRASTAVHPFAEDRDLYYTFSGGDTVVVLRTMGREVPVVRIRVEPRTDAPSGHLLLLRGELDVDATKGHLVRIRGHFVELGRRPGAGAVSRAVRASVHGVAYVELVNAEMDESFWLPAYQRLELHAGVNVGGDSRSILRVISHFREYELDTMVPDDSVQSGSRDTLRTSRRRLTMAGSDTLADYAAWVTPLGAVTASVSASDFDDIAPDRWSPTGTPRLEWRAERLSENFRFNRVEGAYTGVAARLRMRDAAPGVTLQAHAGWAWSEQVPRGGVTLAHAGPTWQLALGAERTLASTNDFVSPLDGASTLAALLASFDYHDYVDRRSITMALERSLAASQHWRVRVETGPERDRAVSRTISRGLFTPDSLFGINRNADNGSSWRSTMMLTYRPEISGEFMQAGTGARIRYERGDGELRWQNVEGGLSARHRVGPFTIAGRAEAGVVIGDDIPPQRLYELGGMEGLRGYAHKEFGGDRAARAQALLLWHTSLMQRPLRVRRYWFPAPAPSLGVSVQNGWTSASPSALRSIARLNPAHDEPEGEGALLSRPSDGVKTSIGLSLRFFGDAVGVGVARAVDTRAPWRLGLYLSQWD
jgi:hypothetical protein